MQLAELNFLKAIGDYMQGIAFVKIFKHLVRAREKVGFGGTQVDVISGHSAAEQVIVDPEFMKGECKPADIEYFLHNFSLTVKIP